jgi:hypothetical protein
LNTTGSATGSGVVDIQNGVGTQDINDAVRETVTLTLSDSEATGLDVSSTQNVVFSPGAATQYVILDPIDGTVPGPITVTVQAWDQFGNIATSEFRDVTLRTTGSASGGGRVNISNGVGTRSISDQVAETVTLTLEDSEVTGLDVSSTQNVVFATGTVARYAIINPTDGSVDAPITVTVQAQDQLGNVVTSENRDVTLVTSGSATGAGLVDIQSGVGSRDISDQMPETVTLTLSDTEGTGLDVSSTQDVIFAPGAATQYVILDPIDGTVDAAITVSVHALDQYGNIATGESRDVGLVTSGSATGGGRVSIASGMGTRLISDQVAETVILTLSDIDVTGLNVNSTQNVVFAVGTLVGYGILDPNDGEVNTPITVTVQAEDQYGNRITAENRDVTLLVSGSATGGGLVDIQDGVGTRDVNDATPETVTLTLFDSQGTGLDVSSTQDVIFAPGAAVRYVILDPADGTVGTPILVTVQALDQFDNIATGENRDVTLVASGFATGDGLVSIGGGVGSRSINDATPETVMLTLSDTSVTGLDVSSTQDVVFAPAPPPQSDGSGPDG